MAIALLCGVSAGTAAGTLTADKMGCEESAAQMLIGGCVSGLIGALFTSGNNKLSLAGLAFGSLAGILGARLLSEEKKKGKGKGDWKKDKEDKDDRKEDKKGSGDNGTTTITTTITYNYCGQMDHADAENYLPTTKTVQTVTVVKNSDKTVNRNEGSEKAGKVVSVVSTEGETGETDV